MASVLSDLDELVLKCRDQKAKSYIREAVACYKAGAFRSAIVSTWIAVSFDILDKLKELSLAGDKEAERQIESFDKARRIGDVANSLKFEREILVVCRDKLELISHVEFIDLNRLQEDRNRCAHPSMASDGEVFNPSAELARMHIRSAVEHLLQYPPAQGKYALDSLTSEVESEYFPTDVKKAVVAFESSPLNKARDSLIRNFTIVLLKKLINDAKDYKEIYRISTALNAIEVIHRKLYRKILTEKLSSIVRSLAVEKLDRVIPLIRHVEDSWSYLEADIRQKIQTYVENLPKEEIENIDIFLSIQGLKSFAEKRLKKATRTELDEAIFFVIPLQVSDRIIELYSESRNFDQANNFASTVIRYATDYSKEQIQKIISVCGDNDQIKHSFDVGSVINSIRKNKNANDDEIDGWLVEADLKRFAKIKDNEADVGN
ncbi:hypothetical protein ACUIJ1_01955 [Acinetobacter junii]|uniref:Uncharacterized protein n=2 Tax=Acinetobacter junii TaxID=40215 RepID=A0ABU8ZLA3_ACIJU|nr:MULTISPECIES: hypothetical protein [Acinetobacter]MBY3626840.1 hypothetical protein [Acinetobacter sp. CUI P1]MDA3502629.1 hypothetical protein [Acinetobacter sp. AOR34_HL]MDA3508411.1 hypothetical protein [Acinetobacter junii]MDA3532768.1 hypothetical protein [Acinetobacter junii]MDH0667006.1 hypothetical protein [Acinetobacter junii]